MEGLVGNEILVGGGWLCVGRGICSGISDLIVKCETTLATLKISELFFFLLHSLLAVRLYVASILKSILVYSQIQSGPVPLVAGGLDISVSSFAHGSI
jgi:Na+/serine symporter